MNSTTRLLPTALTQLPCEKPQSPRSIPLGSAFAKSQSPESLTKEPLRDDEVHLFQSPGHHRNWVDCIRSREKCVGPVEAGARTFTIVHLGNLAYWHGRSFKWDPKNWRFLDDDEANQKSLDRARRDPWQLSEA